MDDISVIDIDANLGESAVVDETFFKHVLNHSLERFAQKTRILLMVDGAMVIQIPRYLQPRF